MKKVVDIKEIQAELRDTMGERRRHVIDEKDEEKDDDDEDLYMYLVDMHPDKQHTYKVAVWAQKLMNGIGNKKNLL